LSNSRRSSEEKASYSLVSTRSFFKNLQKLGKTTNLRILRTVKLLSDAPYIGKSLRGQLGGYYSLRVGDFRIIYTVDESSRRVILYSAGHRARIYKG